MSRQSEPFVPVFAFDVMFFACAMQGWIQTAMW